MNLQGFKRFLSILGIIPRAASNTAITTAGAGTLTAASLVAGLITRSGPTTAFTDTTATAALIEPAMPIPGALNQSWEVIYRNTTAFNATITGGTGVTVSGDATVPGFSTGRFLLTQTAVGTFTMVGYGQPGKATVETVITTNAIDAAESGTTFVLSLATGFDSTLPAPAAGLKYRFIVGVAPTGGSGYTVTATGNLIFGGIGSSDLDAGGDAALGATEDIITFVNDKAVKGDWVEVVSDGTSWFVSGHANAFDGITIA